MVLRSHVFSLEVSVLVGENSSRRPRPSCLLAGGIFSIMYPARRFAHRPGASCRKRQETLPRLARYVYADNKEISSLGLAARAAFCALLVRARISTAAIPEFLCDNFGGGAPPLLAGAA